jgi:hypothetical protein
MDRPSMSREGGDEPLDVDVGELLRRLALSHDTSEKREPPLLDAALELRHSAIMGRSGPRLQPQDPSRINSG